MASNITATGATLAVTKHVGDWHYKQTAPHAGDFVCGHDRDRQRHGVDRRHAYTFKAYSDSGCTTEITTDDTDAESPRSSSPRPASPTPARR